MRLLQRVMKEYADQGRNADSCIERSHNKQQHDARHDTTQQTYASSSHIRPSVGRQSLLFLVFWGSLYFLPKQRQ